MQEEKQDVPAVQGEAAKPAAAVDAPKAAPKTEKPANCAGCNKSIKKKLHYYRDGKYFCTKRCWKTAVKKAKAPAELEKK